MTTVSSAEAGGVAAFLSRFGVTRETAGITVAGLASVVILVTAVLALPRTTTTASRTSGQNAASGEVGNAAGGSASNAPGAGSTTPGARSGASGGYGQAGGGGGASVGAAPPGVTSKFVPARGPGFTSKYVYIGEAYSPESAAGDRAIGAAGAAPSYDIRNVWNAAIDYANRHGGFAGRQMKALFFEINLTEDFNTQLQAACAYWTQDNKVFVLPGGYDVTDACAEKAHTIALGPGATSATFKKYPHLIDPNGTRFDRLGQLTVVGMHKAGYFSGKLGLVTWDDPNYHEALKLGYIDTLAKYNLKATSVAYISVPQTIGALSDTTAQVSSAVAKFKGLGIDHVMILDGTAGVFSGDGLTFEFEQQAKSQNYYPRYGGNSNNSPGFVANPHDEEDHELVISDSWSDKKYDEGWHSNPAREKCFKIQADAGYPVSSSNENDEGIAAIICDYVFMMQRVINTLPAISADSFINGTVHLGKSFPSAFVYGTNFFPGRRDGSDMIRTAEYLNSCQCLKYKNTPAYAD